MSGGPAGIHHGLEKDGFDAAAYVRLVHGPGRADRAGALTRRQGISRVLLVTDAGVVAAGHAARIEASLSAAGLTFTRYDRVRPDPDTSDVDACLAAARAANIDGFVALGGGSAIDTAKGANFLLTNGGRMADYRGHGKATKPLLPLVAIPTTAGTGSECQSYALIGDGETGFKMACGDPSALPRVAILDPLLTLSLPRAVTATAGIDTVVHAIEAGVTRAKNAFSLMYAHEAFRLASSALPRLIDEDPQDLEARGRMQLAAAFAGIAIEHSMLGASHAAANPLSAHYHAPHGQAVGRMLLPVVRYNAADPAARAAYADLARAAGLATTATDDGAALSTLIAHLSSLVKLAAVPSLSALGADEAAIPSLAREAAAQWTAGFNPRPVDVAAFEGLYREALADA